MGPFCSHPTVHISWTWARKIRINPNIGCFKNNFIPEENTISNQLFLKQSISWICLLDWVLNYIMCTFIERLYYSFFEMWIWFFFIVTSHREKILNGSGGFNRSTQSFFCYVYQYTEFGHFLISFSIGEISSNKSD